MKKLFTLIALMCLLVLQGCPKAPAEDPDVLTPIKTEYTIGADGGEMSLQFKTNVVWKAESDSPSWLKVLTPTKAVMTETVKVKAEANTKPEPRTAKVTVSGGDLSITIVVTQEGMTPRIDINGATSFPVGAEGGSVTVDVTSNVDYEVEINANWVTRNGTTFTVEPNESESDRTAVITFRYGDISKIVAIKQNGKEKEEEPYLNIAPTSKSVTAEGETFTLTISTNQGNASVASDKDWVTISGTSVAVAANPNTEARSATVTVTAGSLTKTLTISQAAKAEEPETPDEPVLESDQPTFTVVAAGEEIVVKVRSNVEYETKVNCDWIVRTKSTTVREDVLKFTVAPNEGAAREATIDFTYGSALTVTVTVKQLAYVPPTEDPVLEITPTEAQVAAEGGEINVTVNANYEYTVESDEDWVSINKGETSCVITVAENPTTNPRTGMVYFSSEGLNEFLTIVQAAQEINEDPFDVGSDLSVNGTANTYVVIKAGNYSFDASVMGNGPEGYLWGNETEGETRCLWPRTQDKTIIANGSEVPAKAFVIWNEGNVISNVSYDADTKRISFKANGNKGAALIGLFEKGVVAAYAADSPAIWSWLIWCTDSPKEFKQYDYDDNEYVFLDRNVGAISADPTTARIEDTYGYYFQFGRKDPLRAYVGMARDIVVPGAEMKPSVEHPTAFYGIAGTRTNEWYNSGKEGLARLTADLWGNPQWKHPDAAINHPDRAAIYELKKTIYDPCPPGYMVPPEYAWELLDIYEVQIVGTGVMIPTATGDSFYPFAGYISDINTTETPEKCGWYAFNGFDKYTTTHGESRVAGVYTSHTDWHPGVDSGAVTMADPTNHYGATFIAFYQSDPDDMETGRIRYNGPYYHIRQRGYPIRCIRELNPPQN